MALNITVSNGETISNYELMEDFPAENLVALALSELGDDSHKPEFVSLMKDGKDILTSGLQKSLKEIGVVNGDVLQYIYRQKRPAAAVQAPSASTVATTSTPAAPNSMEAMKERMKQLVSQIKIPKAGEAPSSSSGAGTSSSSSQFNYDEKCKRLFDSMAKDPNVKSNIYAKFPSLMQTYVNNPKDYAAFHTAFVACMKEEERKLAAISNPFSAEGQLLIQQAIDQQNIDASYQRAMEENPEVFIPVHMLYIKLQVNGHDTIAFIDSGAQVSIMSEQFAQLVGMDRLMDKRFRGVASGVGGMSKFAGRIHTCELTVHGHSFDAKFDVLGDRDMDLLIGLDVLRRHHCMIDLKNNKLHFGDIIAAEFLSDAEIKEHKGDGAVMEHDIEVDKEKLEKVIGMGFSKEEAEKALKDSFNDVDGAVHRLFEKQADAKEGAGGDEKMES